MRARRPTSLLGLGPQSLLISLVALTGAAWALTLYHALSMSMPMGVVVRGGIAAEGLGGMAMGGMAAGWSLGGGLVFVALRTMIMPAMILPAAAPMILIFASAQVRRARQAASRPGCSWPATSWSGRRRASWSMPWSGSDIATALTTAERASWAPVALGATLLSAGV